MELIKDLVEVSIDKENKRVLVTRTMVESFEYGEHLRNITRLEHSMDSLDAQKEEQKKMRDALSYQKAEIESLKEIEDNENRNNR